MLQVQASIEGIFQLIKVVLEIHYFEYELLQSSY